MTINKKIVGGIFVLAFLVMSAVPVCGQVDFGSADPSGVHHLGDQTLSDWEVPKPEGTEYTTTFSLTAMPASADLILDVFNTNYNNPVLVNGNSAGILCINTIEGWKQCTIKIPGSALRVGLNTLTIQSESRDRNYDDLMIRNIEVTPSSDAQPTPTPTTLSGVHHLGDQTLSDWEVPKPEGTEYTTTFSLTAMPASADLILDVFNTNYNNPVLVNGNSAGILCINTIEGWKQCTIKIPGSALRVGLNTLTIQSESRDRNYDDLMIRNIEVTPSSDAQPTPTPTTLSGVHHLGDQTMSDWEVPKPEGTEYTTTFSLTAMPASADLILDVFNTNYNNPVLVNGNSAGILCINTIEGWKQCTIKIPGSALRVGLNTLTIQSESRDRNYDDLMIRNIEVTPSSDAQPTPTPTTLSGVHHLGDQTMSDWEVPKPEGTEYTTTFSLTAMPASADLILDVFNTNYNNPVLVNGNSAGILCINTIEGWKQCTIKIPGSALRVGSNTLTIQSESRDRNYDDLMIRNIGITPSSDAPPTTPTPTPPESSVLVFESRSKSSGSTVQIPLTLTGATDKIGNMDVTLGYDPSVLDATEVIKGGLTTTSLFEYNLIDGGTIKISLADKAGFSGDGSIAYVKFNVIGSEGSVSPLKIVSLSANRAKDMAPLSITPQDGVFTVLGFAEGRGDCDGDGEITAADALCALVMAVGKIPEDLVMDVNGDGKVSSGDAREILKKSVKTSGGDSNSFDKKDTDELQKDDDEPSEETLAIDAFLSDLSNLDVDFDSGTFSASDTDNDGKDDLYSYTFEEEDVAEGLSLERKVEYENTDEGLMGSLTLAFENTWGDDDTKSYTHRETIPKSFAENVDELKFSVEPDRIINPDPVGEWELTRKMADEIIIEAEKAAAASTQGIEVPDDRIAIRQLGYMFDILNYVPEPDKSIQDALTKAENTGMSVALGTVLENFDDLQAAHGVDKCNRISTNREKYFCLMTVIAKYPNSFTRADCERLNFDDAPHFMSFSFTSNAACKSVVSGYINNCMQLFIRDLKEKDCRMHVFNFYATRCVNIRDPQTKKDCLFLSAIESGSADACKSEYAALDERQRKVCLAMSTQNINYCREMKNEEDWKNCCELLHPDLKEDCLKKEECDSEHLNLCDNEKECGDAGGYWYNSQCNKEEEEKEDEKGDDKAAEKEPEPEVELPPMPAWMKKCPIPEGTELYVWQGGMISGYSYRYTEPGEYYNARRGPYMLYRGLNFQQPSKFICYDGDGNEHGPFKKYRSGEVLIEGHYYKGEFDKTVKNYAGGVLICLTTYDKGVKDGPYESYDYGERGSLKKGQYKDGKMHGTWQVYRKDGTLSYTQEYNMGKAGEKTFAE